MLRVVSGRIVSIAAVSVLLSGCCHLFGLHCPAKAPCERAAFGGRGLMFPAEMSVITGVSRPDPMRLLSAIPIENGGTGPAENVQVTSVALNGGALTQPTSLPINLGTISGGGSTTVDAEFSGGPFTPGGSYALTVNGTYTVGNSTYCFALEDNLVVPTAAPGSAGANTNSVPSHSVDHGGFPHQPPMEFEKANPSGRTVPKAPPVPGTPTQNGTGIQRAPSGDPPGIVFTGNHGFEPTARASTVAEPSGASGGGVVFLSANWLAAYSTDGGTTFTQLDPTTIFPNDIVGFCCDQVVQYVPSIDRFIWLLQGSGNPGSGYRLASARPSDIINSNGTAWTYWNLTVDVFGQPVSQFCTGDPNRQSQCKACTTRVNCAGAATCNDTWFDYPDLSVGSNYLYVSWDVLSPGCPGSGTGGHQVARIPLAQIQAGATISIDYTNPADGALPWGGHLSQNTGNEVFWAGHVDDSHMRIFSLMEGSNTYFWQDIGISTWATGGLSSTTPDGQDWLTKLSGFPGTVPIGLTRVANQAWFAWSAGTDNHFSQPHVEMVTLNIDSNNPPNLSVGQQVQIWNNSYAFAYPAIATNACTKEVGLSLEYGGKNNYENHVVGFWGDFIVYATTSSSIGTGRYGDYVTIRQQPASHANPGNLFDGFGYGLNSQSPAPGVQTDIRYASFGRSASSCRRQPPPPKGCPVDCASRCANDPDREQCACLCRNLNCTRCKIGCPLRHCP